MTAGNSLFFPAAIWIDNVQLTDQGRGPVTRKRDERSTQNELSSGKRKKYIKAVKHTYSMNWTYLPDDDSMTIDGYAARGTMQSLIADAEDQLLLRFYYTNGSYEEKYVYVSSYEEQLTRRDPVSGVFLWEVTAEFEEA